MPKLNDETLPQVYNRLKLLSIGSLSLIGISCKPKRENPTTFKLPNGVHYQVKKGDTLFYIAKSCGYSVKTLMRANRLYVTELEVGQILFLPYKKFIPYKLTQSRQIVKIPQPYRPAPEELPPPLITPPNKQTPQNNIVSRREWGAAPSKSNSTPMGKITRITLHHTSEYPDMNHSSDKDVIRAIANYHRNTLGWADIGYHYLIGRDGKIYEGRPTTLQGAHTGGHNENNLGISMVGNFVYQLPSSKQLTALKNLLALNFSEYGLSTKNLYGHRDFKATECPGEALYQWLQSYKIYS